MGKLALIKSSSCALNTKNICVAFFAAKWRQCISLKFFNAISLNMARNETKRVKSENTSIRPTVFRVNHTAATEVAI